MNLKNSFVAMGVLSILMGCAWETAVAKQAEKEGDSVHRWGRWAVLAPAAGQEEAGGISQIAASNDLGSCQSDDNCPKVVINEVPVEPPVEPPIEPPAAQSPCEAGMPCGFARVDTPYNHQATAPDQSQVVPFDLALYSEEDGKKARFVVNPGSASAIQSDVMRVVYSPDGTVLSSLRGTNSVLRGSIQPDGLGIPAVIQGVWNHSIGEGESRLLNGGEYVWGIAANADQMQSLISGLGGDKIAIYQGNTMGVVNGGEGAVRMEVNFNTATWTGAFNNDAFTASGVVVDSGFVSKANGFSTNIASGDVKGAFVNAGNNAIGGYEVEFKNGMTQADVFNTRLQRAD